MVLPPTPTAKGIAVPVLTLKTPQLHQPMTWWTCLHLSQKIEKTLLGSVAKPPSHEVDTFTHIKGLIYKHEMDSNQRFLALVILKVWHFTVLIEPTTNWDTKKSIEPFILSNGNITGKAWIRTSTNTSTIVHCVRGKKQGHRYIPFRWLIYLISLLTK